MATTADEIQDNRIKFRALEESARAHVSAGRHESALRSITGGADWAWFNHTGVFASATFEALLPTIGETIVQAPSPVPSTGRRRILHVVTQAYPTGGHSRLVWRWMSLDTSSEHSVLLTSQQGLEIPPQLIEGSDGRLISLENMLMVEKVRALGTIIMNYDLIALHIHPFDAVAVAACAGLKQRPRTLLVNHADHVFWLGLSAADHIVNLRPASERIATTRRTGSSDGLAKLSIPLVEPPSRTGRSLELRKALGIANREPVIATIAQPYKYATYGSPSFVSLIEQLFRQLPAAHLIAVGPSEDTPDWYGLKRAFPTRVHLLGIRTEYTSILDLADVYVDSFPFSSITSMLEAALHSLPVVTMYNPSTGPLNFDDYRLTPDVITSPEDWIERVSLWCQDREAARAAGSSMKQEVAALHGRSAWLEQLDGLYSMSWHRAAIPAVRGSTQTAEYDDAILDLHKLGGLARDFRELMGISGIMVK